MKHLKRLSWLAPYVVILGLLYGGTAQAASHLEILDLLNATFAAILDAFGMALGEL